MSHCCRARDFFLQLGCHIQPCYENFYPVLLEHIRPCSGDIYRVPALFFLKGNREIVLLVEGRGEEGNWKLWNDGKIVVGM